MPNTLFDQQSTPQPQGNQPQQMPQPGQVPNTPPMQAPPVNPPTMQQATSIDLGNEELFARERLSSLQKTIILFVVIGVFAVVLVGGYWLYTSVYAGDFSFAQSNEVATQENQEIDSDSDGLPDAREKTIGTNPNNSDTDGDGYSDGEEVKNGYSPLAK